LSVAVIVIGVPSAYYRSTYAHSKRLREVTPNKFYRCGQLHAAGFRDAFKRFKIGTVINLKQEAKDPLIPEDWQAKPSVYESEVCSSSNVKYVTLDGGVLDSLDSDPNGRPAVIDDFLAIIDQPEKYPPPYLIHCQAGRDRTGLMVAIYRMEYEHRSKADAIRELKANGFATFGATDGNVYVERFILQYEPGKRRKSENRK